MTPPAELVGRDRFRLGAYLFIASGVSIAIIGWGAMLTHSPLVFPSLGPTAFMLFAAPLIIESSPRNVFCGHLIGVLSGVLALAAFGLLQAAPDLEDITWTRLAAVTLALALTLALMTWLGVQHAPAAATTLIVALGLIQDLPHLVSMMVAVVALIVVAAVVNRLHGVRTPVWSPFRPIDRPSPEQ